VVKVKTFKIAKVLGELGNRVYAFSDDDVPTHGWTTVSLVGFNDERSLFLSVRDDVVTALVHACPQLPANARYVWQGRLYLPPKVPVACPRCRYRLDYLSKRQ